MDSAAAAPSRGDRASDSSAESGSDSGEWETGSASCGSASDFEARAREADELVQVRVQRPGGWPAVVPRGYARATSFCRARACWLRAPLASS